MSQSSETPVCPADVAAHTASELSLAEQKMALEVEKLKLDISEVNRRLASKLTLEEKKLAAELSQLTEPWWKKPTHLSTVVTLLVLAGSAVAFVLRYYTGEFEVLRVKEDIEKQRLWIETRELAQERDRLQQQVKDLTLARDSLAANSPNAAAKSGTK